MSCYGTEQQVYVYFKVNHFSFYVSFFLFFWLIFPSKKKKDNNSNNPISCCTTFKFLFLIMNISEIFNNQKSITLIKTQNMLKRHQERCIHFILSKSIIKKVEQICRCFLWKGTDQNLRGAKVEWTDVCKSRSEGGLGMRKLQEWDIISIFYNIWLLLSKAGSLWVAWMHNYLMRGRCF